jgi:phosphoserine phosphatase
VRQKKSVKKKLKVKKITKSLILLDCDKMTIKLVVFDVDGTLTCHSSIWWRLHEHFGTEKEGKYYYDQYFAGEINYDQWAAYDAGLWKGQPLDEVLQVVKETKLMRGAKETIQTLKEHGIHVAILSGGLDVLADDIGNRLGIEYVLTNKLLSSNGILTGGVETYVGWGEKVKEITNVANHFGVELEETAFVGDGRNDVSVFKHVGLSIAFRPEDNEVAKSATVAVHSDDLKEVVTLILQGSRI